MNKTALIAALGIAIASASGAWARDNSRSYGSSGYSYDARSGNTYQSYGSSYNGFNANTGSQWSATSSGGSTRGTDSRGNAWSYDRGSGMYHNYGTGETRYRGRGY